MFSISYIRYIIGYRYTLFAGYDKDAEQIYVIPIPSKQMKSLSCRKFTTTLKKNVCYVIPISVLYRPKSLTQN